MIRAWQIVLLMAAVGAALAIIPPLTSAQGPQHRQTSVYINPGYPRQSVSLRKFPYPFQAMLAIESDADHVTLRKFNLIHEFLNTTIETPMGRGLGLDVSDSFFLYNGSNMRYTIDMNHTPLSSEMTFFKGISHQLYDGPILLYYMKVGWIDTIHSMGDFSRVGAKGTLFTRAQAVYAMHYMMAHGVHITVFTDHGNQSNRANFGAYGYQNNEFFNYQQGDNPYSPYYVTDLLRKEGVRFVWADIYNNQYSYPSMIYPIRLRDGHSIWGFWRFTGTLNLIKRPDHPWIYDWQDFWNPYDLYRELAPGLLRQLIRTHGFTIIAQHLEGNPNSFVLPTSAIESLVRLAHLQDRGMILVARTSRLLLYNLVQQHLRYSTSYARGVTYINIEDVADPVDGTFIPDWNQLHGVTFIVRNPLQTVITLRGKTLPVQLLKQTAHTVGIAWYPPNTANYAVNGIAALRRGTVFDAIPFSWY
ncbi:MAG: hypothetical protein ACYCYO_18665 [Bacilli bacterium]